MSNFDLIDLDHAIRILRRKPGLLFGPGVTTASSALSNIYLARLKGGDESALSLDNIDERRRSAFDLIKAKDGTRANAVREDLLRDIKAVQGSLDVRHLVKADWSVCISLTEDLVFEMALRDYLDSLPSSRALTIVDHPSVVPSDRSLPVYKLLGNVNDVDPVHTLALGESELLLRAQLWPALLRTCPDFLREAPLVIAGSANPVALLRNVLGVVFSMPKPTVARVLFLKDDPALGDPTIRALCNVCDAKIIDANLKDVCAAVADIKTGPAPSALPCKQQKELGDLAAVISEHHSIVDLVPSATPAALNFQSHRLPLIDALFRPALVDWNPYLLNLDLRRTATDNLKQLITHCLTSVKPGKLESVVLHGGAGIGKTSLLKRVAVELAQDGHIVLWCRRAGNTTWTRAYRTLASQLAESLKNDADSKKTFIVMCDDPWGLRLDAGDLMSCFDRFPAALTFVFAVRNSDFFTAEGTTFTIGARPSQELELSYELDEEEIEGLGKMLVKLGAVKDDAAAKAEITRVPSKHADDILCSLWYLVPETRSQLADSLRDEYCRLGEVSSTVASLVEEVANTSQIARRAYEYVTVTSNFDVPLPMEVLVQALRVNYQEWLELLVDGRPLWGLLYDVEDVERGTVTYHTRNEVVTRVLLNLVNGGIGHRGELRVLRELLQACAVGTPIYRGFIIDVLVRSRSKLEKILGYEQGLELYDIARSALPHADRVLEHHKGIWMHHVGHEHEKAYAQLEQALQAPLYPGAERDAPIEYIHTSMAATVVRMVREGKQDRATGLDLVREHLRQASTIRFFNPHGAHVAARLLFELATRGDEAITDHVGLSSLSEALEEIEKALQGIGARGKEYFRFEKEIAMLTDLQRKILDAIPNADQLNEFANALFLQSGNQAGFEVAARKMLAEAIVSGKGKSFNEVKKYLDDHFVFIEGKGKKVSPEFRAVRVDLIIRWRIQRVGSAIDWKSFRDDVHAVIAAPRYRDDAVKIFYYAVALFHCGEITEANAVFAGLRRFQAAGLLPREVRCYYLGKEGFPKRFQARVERQHGRYYLMVAELNTQIPAHVASIEGGVDTTVHTYVGFSMNGPVAVFHRPEDRDAVLP